MPWLALSLAHLGVPSNTSWHFWQFIFSNFIPINFLCLHLIQLPNPIRSSYQNRIMNLFEASPLGNLGSPPIRDISIRLWLSSWILFFVKYGIRPGPGRHLEMNKAAECGLLLILFSIIHYKLQPRAGMNPENCLQVRKLTFGGKLAGPIHLWIEKILNLQEPD